MQQRFLFRLQLQTIASFLIKGIRFRKINIMKYLIKAMATGKRQPLVFTLLN